MQYSDDGFAKRLKTLRQNMGYTQEQVAEALSIHRTTYTYYEMGRTNPPREVLHRLVELFNVSYEELLRGENALRVRVAEATSEADKIYNLPKDELDLLLMIRAMTEEEKREMTTMATSILKRHSRPSVCRKKISKESPQTTE